MREASWHPGITLHTLWVPRAEPLKKEWAQLDGAAFEAKESSCRAGRESWPSTQLVLHSGQGPGRCSADVPCPLGLIFLGEDFRPVPPELGEIS